MDDDNEQLPLFELDAENKEKQQNILDSISVDNSQFSKYVVYVDESGDHGLQSIDEQYPIFVLAFCIFHKRHYSEVIVPALEKFKFNHFGHDQVILHEHEIRKEIGAFTLLKDKKHKQTFLNELSDIIDCSNFILVSCTIDKRELTRTQDLDHNPYHTALVYCMESLFEFLQEKGEENKETHIIVERRGKKEDTELELEFRRICDGQNRIGKKLPFEVIFSNKQVMSTGLQLADLVARPIGLKTLRPKQNNRSFDVLKSKFYCTGGRQNTGVGFEGKGMKVYPRDK